MPRWGHSPDSGWRERGGDSGTLAADNKCGIVFRQTLLAPLKRSYFPLGTDWTHHYTGTVYKGGTTEAIPAPLDSFPLFKRTAGSEE